MREKEARTGGTKCRTVCAHVGHADVGLVWTHMYIYLPPPPGVGRAPSLGTGQALDNGIVLAIARAAPP